jgi:hypothetical protein
MTHPQVADGGVGFQLQRVVVNTLNKQLGPSSLGIRCGADSTSL